MRYSRLMLKAASEAAESTYRWRVGAIVAIRSRIVSKGHSSLRHPPGLDFRTASVHAEVAATKGC